MSQPDTQNRFTVVMNTHIRCRKSTRIDLWMGAQIQICLLTKNYAWTALGGILLHWLERLGSGNTEKLRKFSRTTTNKSTHLPGQQRSLPPISASPIFVGRRTSADPALGTCPARETAISPHGHHSQHLWSRARTQRQVFPAQTQHPSTVRLCIRGCSFSDAILLQTVANCCKLNSDHHLGVMVKARRQLLVGLR